MYHFQPGPSQLWTPAPARVTSRRGHCCRHLSHRGTHTGAWSRSRGSWVVTEWVPPACLSRSAHCSLWFSVSGGWTMVAEPGPLLGQQTSIARSRSVVVVAWLGTLWSLQRGQRYEAHEVSLNSIFGRVCCVTYTYLTTVGFSFVGKQTCKPSHCLFFTSPERGVKWKLNENCVSGLER